MGKGAIKITYGYARVSTTSQKEDRQIDELLKYGISAKRIFTDKQSGKDFKRGMNRNNSFIFVEVVAFSPRFACGRPLLI